jgi:hypothetical protein
MNKGALSTVDPRYVGVLKMMFFLDKLSVIKLGQKKHSFSAAIVTMRHFEPKPHWIAMAVVSLSLEYMEIVPLGVKYAKKDT